MITASYGLTATERVLPKLALDFTTASLDSRITFTRTTGASNPATYVNSSGVITSATNDQPRFDYNPTTLVCNGLLIEESRANKCLYSDDFRNTADAGTTRPWTYTNATLSRTGVGPDGKTANKIIPNVGATDGRVNQGIPVTSGLVHTISIYGKADGHSTLNITSNLTGTFRENRFNVSTGQVILAGTGFTCSIQAFNNGYYRCVMTATSGTTSLTVQVRDSDTGDGVNGIIVSDIQVEEGSFATSLIPTAGSILTRNADVATMTGTNFSNWFNASEGAAVVQVLPSTISGTRPAIEFDDNTANQAITLRGVAADPQLFVVNGGAAQATLDAGTITANAVYKLGGAWKSSSFAASVNGGGSVSQLSGTYPTVTQARLGSDGTNYLNGCLQNLRYWPQRITNAETQAFSK